MSISPISTNQDYSPQKQARNAETGNMTFAAALKQSQNAEENNRAAISEPSSSHQDEEFPLESYALPKWYNEYVPEACNISTEINYEFFAFAESLRKEGRSPEERGAILGSILDHDPKHQANLEKERFREKFKNELFEYTNILHDCFQKALKENGVESHADYYEKALLDANTSETIHQDMVSHLDSNPRFSELKDILGIKV